ncbi:MAG: orotidine-5'-phosphate decarboxylase [Robiginitomaculum sp.]|nr:MAG: orotidine-5'-phosphate decarboxylase [Robiginitomaculum sp.]
MHFGDHLAKTIATHGPLCVGLDPHPGRIPGFFGDGLVGIEAFFMAVLSRLDTRCGIIKPQIAFFERYGPDGLAVMARLCAHAKARDLLVLMDAKRGDIGSTASAYASGYLGPDAWVPCDAITVNPYMGMDTLEPFLAMADDQDKGIIVLVRTSNPGAADFEDLSMDGKPLYQHIAAALAPFARDRQGPQSGWSSLMVVVGATAPSEARQLRITLPHSPFLVPGYGAQGASAQDAVSAARDGQGVVVNSSRGVLYPPCAKEATSFTDWDRLFDAALEKAHDELTQALGA